MAVCMIMHSPVKGQIDTSAMQYWDTFFSPLFSGEGYKVNFECIINGFGNPLTMEQHPDPACDVGGHLHVSENKYEIDYGIIKVICDHQLVVMVNETDRSMMVDSVSRSNMQEAFSSLLNDSLQQDDLSLTMMPVRFLNTDYRAVVSEDETPGELGNIIKVKTYFLVNEKEEWKHWIEYRPELNEYTWFTIGKTGVDTSIKEINIFLPDHEIEEFAGYQVFDYRFIK